MLIQVLKCKVHRVTVTDHNLDYEGSLTLDRELMDRAGLLPYEKVAVWNVSNGNRFETYMLEGRRGGGDACVNGAAAHLAKKGDILIVAAYALIEPPAPGSAPWQPRVVRVDDQNRPLLDDAPERAR